MTKLPTKEYIIVSIASVIDVYTAIPRKQLIGAWFTHAQRTRTPHSFLHARRGHQI